MSAGEQGETSYLMKQAGTESGFSLIEIMVALFIVGLTTSFVILSLPRGADPFETSRETFQRQLDAARDVSMTSGETFGILVRNNKSSMLVYRRGEWEPAAEFGELAVLDVAGTTSFEILSARKEFKNTLKIDEEKDAPLKPQIWFDAAGISTAQSVRLVGKTRSYRFDIQRNGDVSVSVSK